VADRIGHIQVMGGALRVGGNPYGSALPGYDNSQEFNMWLDPVSARALLRAARPGTVHLVPLDASASVPITQAFIARLAADQHAPGARLAYAIASQPDLSALIDLGIMYWWDALAAVYTIHDDGSITTFEPVTIDVVEQGTQSGRTVLTPSGQPVAAAIGAHPDAFEQRSPTPSTAENDACVRREPPSTRSSRYGSSGYGGATRCGLGPATS
jgi:purine nucleosidase